MYVLSCIIGCGTASRQALATLGSIQLALPAGLHLESPLPTWNTIFQAQGPSGFAVSSPESCSKVYQQSVPSGFIKHGWNIISKWRCLMVFVKGKSSINGSMPCLITRGYSELLFWQYQKFAPVVTSNHFAPEELGERWSVTGKAPTNQSRWANDQKNMKSMQMI